MRNKGIQKIILEWNAVGRERNDGYSKRKHHQQRTQKKFQWRDNCGKENFLLDEGYCIIE
jgi:hypothetical protein